ncbi:MAG TPA: hypothetical protein GXZ28_09810 [Clostridiales bacterium]|nr:hypothetical protein [Clostridiales bacterium]
MRGKQIGKKIGKQIGILAMVAIILMSLTYNLFPNMASGEVKPITEIKEKLEGISEEEKKILKELFTIRQEIYEKEKEEARISGEINILEKDIDKIRIGIDEKQKDYDDNLQLLKQVLQLYQRGGPASYLEILLGAKDLRTFLNGLNLIKDISRNVDELLTSLEEDKKNLQDEKAILDSQMIQLEQKMIDLQRPIEEKLALKLKMEEYLANLQEEKEDYEEQLKDLEQLWGECKLLFSNIVSEMTRIVGEGHFKDEDLNLSFGLFRINGLIHEDTFNRIIKEHSNLPETNIHFSQDQVQIQVPDWKLVLSGNFILEGDTSIRFVVKEGTFYGLPLEETSLEELFEQGPLFIDLKDMAGDMVTIDFYLHDVDTLEDNLKFTIIPVF